MKTFSRKRLNALIAPAMLSLSACSSQPFVLPTPAPIQTTPAACLTKCPPLPEPAAPAEKSMQRWELDLIQAAEKCTRLHDECRAGMLRRTE